MSKKEKSRRGDDAGWSSDEEYQGSRGSEDGWRSDNDNDNDWNEDSSMAGEASVMSEGTEEEQLEEEEKMQIRPKNEKPQTKKYAELNLDDVGTEDDGESRHPEDITERTERQYSKTNVSDMSDMSDIEDQIAEAQNKFMDDKQSLSGVMGLVDEVTMKGENLTRKASETSLVIERDSLKKGVLSNDQISMFDDDEMSFRSYTERTSVDDNVPQRDSSGIPAGRIEYINYDRNTPKESLGMGRIEYLDTQSNDSGSLISGPDQSVSTSEVTRGNDDEKEKTETENLDNVSDHKPDERSLTSSKSNETLLSGVSTKLEAEEPEPETDHQADKEKAPSEQDDETEETKSNSPELKDFEEPECSKFGERHLCCFINIGGGGDDGRESGLVDRLKKLKDDIANMRKELSLARQECKKESEEVAKLIEAAAERNKAAETEMTLANSSAVLSTYTPQNYTLEDVMPINALAKATILPGRTQVAIPSSLLHDRLQATRQTASSTYRESLNELERMVEKEMASIKDSMIRLEPLNKIAAEWDAILPARQEFGWIFTYEGLMDPKRKTYTRDYRLEMVTSEMRLQAPDVAGEIQ